MVTGSPDTRLEDFGVLETPLDRIKAHQRKCRQLPREAQAMYWRGVYKEDPELFKIMNGRDYKEAQRRLRAVRR